MQRLPPLSPFARSPDLAPGPAPSQDTFWFRVGLALLALGSILHIWLATRSWFYFDQVLLYQLGIHGLESGQLYPFAKAVSGSAVIPGALLELLIQGPLALWFDFRSPIILLGILQLVAGTLLWRTIADTFSEPTAAVYLAVYWLGPWHLYHAGFVWEPNYLLLPAALHLWASLRLERGSHFVPSAVLGAVAVTAIQLHPSGIVFGVATLLLWVTRSHTLHLVGALTGALISSLSLIPTASAWLAGTLPTTTRAPWQELGIVRVYPLLKDFGYWFRLGSFDIGRRMRQVEFGPSWNLVLTVLAFLLSVSLALTVLANFRFVRKKLQTPRQNLAKRYCGVLLLSHLFAIAVSTVTPQSWHLLVLLHAAALPVALHFSPAATGWSEASNPTSRPPVFRRRWAIVAVWIFIFLRLPIAIVLGLGHPMYVEPDGDPNRIHIEAGNFDRIELVPIPFGGAPSSRGAVPWELEAGHQEP